MFGGSAVADLGDLSARHRELTERLIVPSLPTDGTPNVIADAAGVSVEQAKRVRDRFARVPGQLPHTARNGTPRSPTPAELLARWCETMTPTEPDPPPSDPPTEKEYANVG